MVEEKELVVIFKRKNLGERGMEFVPIKVAEGYYNEEDDWFVCDDGTGYTHISEYIYSGNAFGLRCEISKLIQDNPDMTLPEIKKEYLKKAKESKYFRPDEEVFIEDGRSRVKRPFVDKDIEIIEEAMRDSHEKYEEYVETKKQEENKQESDKKEPLIKMTPQELSSKVKETIKGQDEAVDIIVKTIWLNLNYPELQKKNLLVIGPTGVGKTAIFEAISRIIDIPLTIFSVPGLSQAGYAGKDTEEILKSVLINSGKSVSKAEKSIVVLDEIDKLACPTGETGTVATKGVQNELLKIIEGTVSNISLSESSCTTYRLDTSRIVFVGTGAFTEIYEERDEESRRHPIGFDNQKTTNKLKKSLGSSDLVKYGLKRELVGRLPVLLELRNLTKDDLKEIVTSNNNELSKIITLLEKSGVICSNINDIIDLIAQDAISKKIGARGLLATITGIFINILDVILTNPGKYSEVIIGQNILNDKYDFNLIEKESAKKRVRMNK